MGCMGCATGKSTEEKENKPITNNNVQVVEVTKKDNQVLKEKEEEERKKKEEEERKKKEEEEKKKKEEEEKMKKEEEEKKKKEESGVKIVDSLIVLPEDNIELASFTAKTMDLKKMRELELSEHNQLRALHGADPLTLNNDLNEMAQKYAKVLAKKKKMEHSKDRKLKGKEGEWVGENLFCKNSSGAIDYTSGDMSKAWYSEIKDYDFQTGKSKGESLGISLNLHGKIQKR